MLSIEGNFGRTLPTGSVSQRKRYDCVELSLRRVGPPARTLCRHCDSRYRISWPSLFARYTMRLRLDGIAFVSTGGFTCHR